MIKPEESKKFQDFLGKISKKSRVGIFSDSDLDGITSAIFMEEILKDKGIVPVEIVFLDHKYDVIDKINEIILKNKLDKIIILDFNIDNQDVAEFNKIIEKYDTLLVDHHPLNSEVKDLKWIIKTKSEDCVALDLYRLDENLSKSKKWEWLLVPTMISEFSYTDNENFNFLKKLYPELNKDKIRESVHGEILDKLGSLIIYNKGDFKKSYEVIKSKKFQELDKIDSIVKKDVKKYMNKFAKEIEKNKEKKNILLCFESPFEICNSVTTMASMKNSSKTFIGMDIKGKEFIRMSFRNQSGEINMGNMASSLLEGLEKATYGGHVKAAGGMFLKKDLNEVMKRLEKLG